MNVNMEQIHAGIIRFIDEELAPRANGLQKFMLYFAVPSLSNILNNKFEQLRVSGLFNDVLTEDGLIKLDEVYNRAAAAMQKSGKILIPQLGYLADADDLTRLYNIIKSI